MDRDLSTENAKKAMHYLNMIACSSEPDDYQVEALSKYIPTYVIEERTTVGNHVCPSCHAGFIELAPGVPSRTNYCGNCGQHLAWK